MAISRTRKVQESAGRRAKPAAGRAPEAKPPKAGPKPSSLKSSSLKVKKKSTTGAPKATASKPAAKAAPKEKAKPPVSAEAKARLEAVKAAALRAKAGHVAKKVEVEEPVVPEAPVVSGKEPRRPAPAPAATIAPRARRKVAPWAPKEIPLHTQEGRAQDPRLVAALAARERWHGRSGRPALKSATQAIAFTRERNLVHPVVQSALPNLLDPLIGRSCTDQERATGPLASTLGAWMPEIMRAPDLLVARLCFEQPTLVRAELWPSMSSVTAPREEEARSGGLLTREAEEALEILDRRGEVTADRLARLLDLSAEEFAKVQGELESRLVVLSRPDVDEDDQPVSVLEPIGRWAERALGPRRFEVDLQRAWTFLFIAALRAAVVLWPEEIEALYPWTAAERNTAIAEAMSTGAVVTYHEGDVQAFVASPVPR